MDDDDQPTTGELRAIQVDRAEFERRAAQEVDEEAAQRAHGRRAEKADYLAEKLDDQAEALGE